MRLVADENIPLVDTYFGQLGEVVRRPGRSMSAGDLRSADVLLVRSVTQVNASLLAGSSVRFVGTCTIGEDHLDKDYLDGAGIGWASAPGCNANSVVEYVYAALAHLDCDWQGRSVGIVGCGNVGGRLYARLKAQGVDCRCYDPFLSPAQNPDLTSLERVLASDIVCLHTPLTRTGPHPSYHMIGARELAMMPSSGVLLNAGRGAVVDNADLLAHLKHHPQFRAVLDVWEPEPDISRPLLDKVALGTPHIAGYSYDGKIKGTYRIYRALCEQLGVTPQHSLESGLPVVQEPVLSLSNAQSDWANVQALLPRVYDIAEDDRKLRTLARGTAQGSVDFAQGFDRLRKDYPVRREFGNYRVEGQSGSLPESLKQRLGALGFSC